MNYCQSLFPFIMRLKPNSKKKSKFFKVTMLKNTFLLTSHLFYPHKVSYINPPVLILLSKMESQKGKIEMLLHAHVLVHHWGDVVLTKCFIVYQMPSSSIDNKISYSILFPKEPLFHVAPRVFGCTYFVHVCPG